MADARGQATQDEITSDQYLEEYKPSFVDKWDELINWEGREKGEDGFFTKLLNEYGCKRVLDAATGTGFHAVMLKRDGFDVVAADGAEEMIRKTKENAAAWNTEFPAIVADWRELSASIDGQFDAIVCLGNAFTHLFDEDDRVKTLAEFRRALRPGGILVIDQRNYDSILDQGFNSKHSYYYVGKEVDARPIEIDDNAVKFEYSFPDGSKHHLTMFPIRASKMTALLKDAGFKDLKTYGDFKADYDPNDADFLVHVAVAG